MHIKQASVSFQAQHQLQRQHDTRVISTPSDNVPPPHPLTLAKTESPVADGFQGDAQLLIIKRILEAFLGREIVLATYGENAESKSLPKDSVAADMAEARPPPEQWVHLSLREAELSQFAIRADITLGSGQTRRVLIEASMARYLSVELDVTSIQAAKIIDPLVINFGGSVELSGKRVEFDLDADGKLDSIASFSSNSAFIAWDGNGDGKINNGSELFGALSGNGFAELAVFDDDGNGFIDQRDAIFSQLQVYKPGQLSTRYLTAAGVEALYLGSVETPFTLGEGVDDLGYVRSTGFYLTEHGAGTLQQIDLLV